MRMRIVCALALIGLAGKAVHAQQSRSVHGTRLEVDLRAGPRISGELLAVQRDTLWLLPSRGGMSTVPLADVTHARIPQHGLTRKTILIWTLVGGVVTGAALTAACNSVEDTDCGGVFPITLLSWGVFGGLSALVTAPGMRPVNTDAPSLTPYARFPQGMPAGFAPGGGKSKQQPDSAKGGGPGGAVDSPSADGP